MDFRHTRKGRGALSAVAVTAGLLLTVAGCGGGGDDNSGKESSSSAPSASGSGDSATASTAPSSDTVLAEVKGENGITLTVTSAEREDGGFVTVNGTVTNNTDSVFVGVNWRGDEQELAKNGGSMAGASLVDQKGKKKYLILRDTSGDCLCTTFGVGVKSGATTTWYAQFPAPPTSTTEVDFEVGDMPPAAIKISDGE
ncbi:hypothetical protein OK074_6492 [Actinobacteria bacterium OK074]|nr:hypothetical protein OK074_6492 [Actinobacteria bacterium OK074]